MLVATSLPIKCNKICCTKFEVALHKQFLSAAANHSKSDFPATVN